MRLDREITDLRKSGRLDEAYRRGKELLSEYPEDIYIRKSFGWVLYEKLKNIVEEAAKNRSTQKKLLADQLKGILGEYYKLKLDRPDLLFSLLLSQTLRFPEELKFLPKFMIWAGIDSFRPEDLKISTTAEGKVFESLLEKTARKVGKVSGELTREDYSDIHEIQHFAVKFITYALESKSVQKPEWLIYHKALLLKSLGELDEARNLLISLVQQKRGDFWAWHKLAKVIETSDSTLALALCAKACLTCKDPNFGVSVFEDLSRLAASENERKLAKWSAEQAFTIRSNNGWKITQPLHDILSASWYSRTESLLDPQQKLLSIAADAERVIWANHPKYNANYLGTFLTKNQKKMVKFGLLFHGEPKEISSPERGLPNNLSLSFGDPVTVIIEESRDRPTVVIVEKRESGKIFDSMPCRTGQFQLKKGGFGFLDDIYVPHDLANQLKDGEIFNLVFVKKFDKKKSRWGLTAIAAIDDFS